MHSHANWLNTKPVWSVLGSSTGLWLIHKSGLIKGMPRQPNLSFSHTSPIDLFRSCSTLDYWGSPARLQDGENLSEDWLLPTWTKAAAFNQSRYQQWACQKLLVFIWLTCISGDQMLQCNIKLKKTLSKFMEIVEHASLLSLILLRYSQKAFKDVTLDVLLRYCLF